MIDRPVITGPGRFPGRNVDRAHQEPGGGRATFPGRSDPSRTPDRPLLDTPESGRGTAPRRIDAVVAARNRALDASNIIGNENLLPGQSRERRVALQVQPLPDASSRPVSVAFRGLYCKPDHTLHLQCLGAAPNVAFATTCRAGSIRNHRAGAGNATAHRPRAANAQAALR